ncbi:hypothetical protein ONR75_07340 [Rhodopseudomonas sp. P2A-2r]|uniref:hypothetical protein n=1 Tax=Rhodopseudomonas sp. P2A-2r TaxID=2991972 RepID=UPI00223449C4|nr:hypothetical protein [Rhodopseudomonas sp. P2A-2r]UZE50496.1 hypothetical protein ONR75_07340 [Rhodopseudomonas sp. P2A-2r]
MTEIKSSTRTTRERFMASVRDEMAAFEKREHELQKQARKERAAELRLPVYIES